MSGELLVIREDGTHEHIPNEYEQIKLAIGNWIDVCRGYGPVSAFVDDEGLLRGRQFNPVGSMCLGRPVFGPVVLTAPEPDDEGETLPPPEGAVRAFVELGNIWQQVVLEATQLGQDLTIMANPATVPGPVIISLDDPAFNEWLSSGKLLNVCPATGGDHSWTDDVDFQYSDRRSSSYIPPEERWHCEECGMKRPEEDL